jgi:hypothetical protein
MYEYFNVTQSHVDAPAYTTVLLSRTDGDGFLEYKTKVHGFGLHIVSPQWKYFRFRSYRWANKMIKLHMRGKLDNNGNRKKKP